MLLRILLGGARGGSQFTPPSVGTGILTPGTITTITDDTKYNAWPVFARLADGQVLMVYTKGDSHNLDNTGKIVGRLAADATAALAGTYGAEFTIADDTVGCINAGVLVTTTGRVLVTFNLYDYGATPRTPVDAVRSTYSDDGCATWSSPATMNSAFTSSCANGTTNPVQLADGSILNPVYGLNSGDTYWSASVFKSTDNGATWGSEVLLGDGEADGRNYYEPGIVLLDDDRLLGLYRTTDGAGTHYKNYSTDSGATWGATSAAYSGFGASRVRQLSTGTVMVVTRRSADSDLTSFTSRDSGATWTEYVLVTPMFESEYGDVLELAAGSLLVVFGDQPTSSTSNADVKQIAVTETLA